MSAFPTFRQSLLSFSTLSWGAFGIAMWSTIYYFAATLSGPGAVVIANAVEWLSLQYLSYHAIAQHRELARLEGWQAARRGEL